MSEIIFTKDRIQYKDFKASHYYCESCNGYNDILSYHCVYCKAYNNLSVLIAEQRSLIKMQRSGLFEHYSGSIFANAILDNEIKKMSEQSRIELHSQWFNRTARLVSEMDFPNLQAFIEEQEMICLEAKANLNAARDEERTRKAKLSPGSKEWLAFGDEFDPSITDRIAKKPRTSKLDNLKEKYKSMGIEMSPEIEAMIIKKQTADEYKESPHKNLIQKPSRTAGMTESEVTGKSELDLAIEKAKKKEFEVPKKLDFNELNSFLTRKNNS